MGSESERAGTAETGERIDGFDLPNPNQPREQEVKQKRAGRPRGSTGANGSQIVDSRGNLKRDPREYSLFTLDFAFKKVGGREAAINLAKLCSASDDRMARVVELYEGLSKSSQRAPNKLLERLCVEAGVDPSEFLGRCAAAAHKHQLGAAALLASGSLQEIVEMGTEMAKQPGGFKDRELIYEHMAFLPQTKGAQVAIQVNTGSGSTTALPNFAELAQLASGAIGAPRQLEAAQEEDIIDGELISNSFSSDDSNT